MVVWCPDWPVMAPMAEQPAGSAIAVFDKGMVLACNPAARADGVRRGMRRRDAQSRCPGLVVADHRPEVDARAFEDVLLAIEEPWSRPAASRAVCTAGAGELLWW